MNYKHLNINERACIFEFNNMGLRIREIAKRLDRSPSTISREINTNKRKAGYTYHPVTSQKSYETRREKCHRTLKLDIELKEDIEEKLLLTWSSEQIANYESKFNLPSYSTIYNWINKKYILNGDKKALRRKGRSSKTSETRGKFNIDKTIKQRPKEVYTRKTLGHWEADTVVSGRGNGKSVIITIVERKSRILHTKLLLNRKHDNVTNAIIEMLSVYPKELAKTITVDRGKEFAGYRIIEKELDCCVYFSDAYCSWQRGTNENINGLLREFFPKGMNLGTVTNAELNTVTFLINNRPRKCIQFSKPIDYISRCCT